MTAFLWGASAIVLFAHGLVHLMGFFAYWPLMTLAELPYKTTLLGGNVDIGVVGTQMYSILWLSAALGFIATSIAMFLGWSRWQIVLLIATILSLTITILDWSVAFRGTLIDVVILAMFAYIVQNSRHMILRGR